MRKINLRRTWLLVGLSLLLVTSVMAQGAHTLVPGTPLTGTLNSNNLVQVYTFDGSAGEVVTLTAVNQNGVPLALVLTDSAGTAVAQAYDLDITGQVGITNITLPTTDSYFVTLFKSAGVDSFTDVTFTLTSAIIAAPKPTAAATSAPTVAMTAGATPEATTAVNADGQSTQLLTTSGLQVVLTWSTADDLDLEVRDPVGGSLYWETPTVDSGGSLSPNLNQGCTNTTATPTETASWTPGGIPTGSYEMLVYYQAACTGQTPVSFTLATTVDGEALDLLEGTVLEGQVFVASFVVNADGTSELTGLSGIVTNDLPAEAATLIAQASPISIGSSLSGTISNDQSYQVYSFQGQANDLVTIDMAALSGNLDPFLFLLDARGNVLNSNDDAVDGSTNAQITSGLLPEAGTYTIVATRYAKRIGGTEGDFSVTLSTQTTQLPQAFLDLPRGALEVRLLWQNGNDLQLLVRDPAGNSVFDDVPEIRSGGRLAAAGNVNCTPAEGTPFSYIYWPAATPPRPGVYEVEVWFQSECNDTSALNFNLSVSYNGQEVLSDQARPLLNERYLTSFTITADGEVIPSDGGIITGIDSLNYQSDLENAVPLLPTEPRNGSITQDNKFDLYVFTGQAGDVYNIAMNNTSGTLDPSLYLIAPDGSQAAANDDAVAGENTNSLIANLTLPADGQYIIIATHFGAQYGGTTGTYSLTLTKLN
ncbi:MAG: pre-peptidase C-terminal domain-containing protein [Chloroflexota bacterium]